MAENDGTKSDRILQHLTFKLKKEVFAFEIAKVREVIDFSTVTHIPGTPDFMRGVINLRGNVVPVIDLQMKFGMGRTEKTINTCVIIVEVPIDHEVTQVGALADSVKEVVDLEKGDIEPPPRIGMTMDGKFIKGMGKHNEEFIIILDIEKIFTTDEIEIAEDMKRVFKRKYAEDQGEEQPESEAAVPGEGSSPLPTGQVAPEIVNLEMSGLDKSEVIARADIG